MKVYGSGDFNGHHCGEQPGSLIPIGASFTYGGSEWLVPAAYRCEKNLIIDLCRKVERDKIEAFYTKWYGRAEGKGEGKMDAAEMEDEAEMEAEDPMECAVMRIRAEWNGQSLPGCCWSRDSRIPPVKERPESAAAVPVDPETGKRTDTGEEGRWMEAYGLDPSQGWNCFRLRFPLPSARKDAALLSSLTLTLEPRKTAYPIRRRVTVKPDGSPERVPFIHPLSKETYELCLMTCRPETLPEDTFNPLRKSRKRTDADLPEYPRCYCEISYRIEPPLPEGDVLTLRDCSAGDSPNVFHSHAAAAVGIIGGASTVTSFAAGVDSDGKPAKSDTVSPVHVAYTSLTYKPVTEVEAALLLQRAPYGPGTFDLITGRKDGGI